MFKIMLTLHLLTAIFAIGPLAHAVTTATRGLRTGDQSAAASSARTATIYSYASVLVVIFGFGLMSATSPYTGAKVASFGQTWIWLSLILWIVAVGICLLVTVPGLKQAATTLGEGGGIETLKARVAGSGGVIALLFVAIVVLMIYQPGGN